MDDRYGEYFRDRLRELEELRDRRAAFLEPHPVADEAAREAVAAARRAAIDADVELRGDAELVILLLAYELVARPVSAARPQVSRDLQSDLAADATLLVRRAAADVHEPEREVSAHRVIDALSDTWDELRSGRYDLWDQGRRRNL